jgi:hypothetical protein
VKCTRRTLLRAGEQTGYSDAARPESDVTAPAHAPVADDGDGAFTEAVVDAVDATLDVSLDVELEDGLL